MAHLSDVAIAQLLARHGLSGSGLVTGIMIVLAESGGNTDAVNHNSDSHRSIDRGLWQYNDYWHREVSDSCAFDPDCSTTHAALEAPLYPSWHGDIGRRQQFKQRALKAAQEAGGGGSNRPICLPELPGGGCRPGYTKVPGEPNCPCRLTGLFDDRNPLEDIAGKVIDQAGFFAGILGFVGKLPRYLEAGAGGFVILFGAAIIAHGAGTKSASLREAFSQNAVSKAGGKVASFVPAGRAAKAAGAAKGAKGAAGASSATRKAAPAGKAPAPAKAPPAVTVPERGRTSDMSPEQKRELVRQMNQKGARAA